MKRNYGNKYKDFKYEKKIKEDLDIELDKEDLEKFESVYENIIERNDTIINSAIAKDVFKMAYVLKYPNSFIATVYNVSVRTVQLWLCDLKINKTMLENDKKYKNRKCIIDNFKNKLVRLNNDYIGKTYSKWTVVAIDVYMSYIKNKPYLICRCRCANKTIRSVSRESLLFGTSKCCGCKMIQSDTDIQEDMLRNKDFCLYRFLNKNKNVLYIGKCTRTFQHSANKSYFIQDRLNHHYYKSSKQLPKSLYLNTKYIEISFPNVSSNQELEKIESELISYYERIKFQCNYNSDLQSDVRYIDSDDLDWILYNEKTDKDIEGLMKNYGYNNVPPIEIINERLRAMVWLKNNLNKIKNREVNNN